MVNCSRLSQQMHLLLTYHFHMNGVHLCPDKLLDKLFVICVTISIQWQLQISTSDYWKALPSLFCAHILQAVCFSQLINPNLFVTKSVLKFNNPQKPWIRCLTETDSES